jgi:type II secretion system protein C
MWPVAGRGEVVNKTSYIHKRKIFLFIRLSLLLVLGYTTFRTILIVQGEGETLAPSLKAEDKDNTPVVSKGFRKKPGDLPKSSDRDYSAIFERNLFGNPTLSLEEEKQPTVHDDSDVENSNREEIDVALLGTVAGGREVSRAIIEDLKTSSLSLVKVGDTVASASIESIEKDKVVLLHNGHRTIVYLGAGESKQDGRSVLAREPAQRLEVPQAKPPTTIVEKLRYAATMLPRATIKPYTVEGRIEGLRITGLDRIEHLEDIGLKNGDVIRSVNGHLLTSKQEAFQISRKARSQADVSIELMRDNKMETFSFHLGRALVESRNAGRGIEADAVEHST